MTVKTLQAHLACPSCGAAGLATITLKTDGAHLRVGDHPGTVSECSACWQRRASLIAQAKARLRAGGEMGRLHPHGQDTWRGVPVDHDDEGAFENAVLSEVARLAGTSTRVLGPATACVTVRLRGGQARIDAQPGVAAVA